MMLNSAQLSAQTIQCGTGQVQPDRPELRQKTDDLTPGYDVSEQTYHVIPVVVHNFYDPLRSPYSPNPRADSLPPSLIRSQIRALNDHFGRAGDYKNVDVANGADTRIRFCLAKQGPDGQPTNGINYLKVNDASVTLPSSQPPLASEKRIKDSSRWPTDRYLNIWVVREITSDRENQRVQGYAYLPENNPGQELDGIVMDHRYFGRNNPRNVFYEGGKVVTHEVGHYLNLLHPWGPTPESGCREDDEVDDTPFCRGPFEKIRAPDPCEPEPRHECRGFDRMTSNYMEYSIDRCMKAFTAGQRQRMRNAIAEYRPKLVSFTNLQNAGCTTTFDTLNSRDTVSTGIYPQVNAFPNPASERIVINTLAKERKVLTATLYRASGQPVRRLEGANFRTGRTTMPVSDLQAGVYILRVAFDDTVKEQKVIIQP